MYIARHQVVDIFSRQCLIFSGVPAHDTRDLQFAREHDLPVMKVVSGDGRDGDKIINSYQVRLSSSSVLSGPS